VTGGPSHDAYETRSRLQGAEDADEFAQWRELPPRLRWATDLPWAMRYGPLGPTPTSLRPPMVPLYLLDGRERSR
jgi:hypothetical protein